MTYDSADDTWQHILTVQQNLDAFCGILASRAIVHDQSKLHAPEKAVFDEVTPRLASLTYDSEAYRASLAEMKPALDHHYAMNTHHPEHNADGIDGMSLLDIVEMFCDWRAATMRHADGNFAESLQINRKRFEMSDQLASIFENTRKELGW